MGKIWGIEVVLVVLGVLAMAHYSHQLTTKHPLYGVVQKINSDGPYLGLVLGSVTTEKALKESNSFIPSISPPVSISGRTFRSGKINGAKVIYVQSGDATINAAATVQLLLDTFDIEGIVHFGSAGAVNDSLAIGDVVSPGLVAYTGSWTWKKYGSKVKKGELHFADYNKNVTAAGGNYLQSVEYGPTRLYTPKKNGTIFWLPLKNTTWFETVAKLQNIELQQCLTETKCLPRAPVLVRGLKASTADIYVQNEAYRDFLYDQFGASIVDDQTAAVALVALSNQVPVIVFRGVSNTAGGSTAYKRYGSLASVNAVKVAVAFIGEVASSSTITGNGRPWIAQY